MSFFHKHLLLLRRSALRVCAAVLIASTLWAAGCVSTASRVSQGAHFYFVQLSDTHFGERNNTETTRRLVGEINKLTIPIEFVAVTGDITGNRMADGFTFTNGLEVLKGLKAPFHMLPGNHDILRNKLAETVNAYTNLAGPLLTRAEYKGVVCVFMYVEPLRDGFVVEGYDPLKELDKCLKDAEGKPAIVFLHSPPVQDFYNNVMHPGWPEAALKDWERVINRHNVTASIAGHFHRDEMHIVGRVPLFVGPAVAPYWDRPPAFRIYECNNGRITGYRTQYLPLARESSSR